MFEKWLTSFTSVFLALPILSATEAPAFGATFYPVLAPLHGAEMGIMIRGEIDFGDARQFLIAINKVRIQYPDHRLRAIGLDSPGGLVEEALQMSRVIHENGFVAVVPNNAVCASACTILFSAGSIKVVAATGHLGVHGAAVNGSQDLSALAITTLIAKQLASYGAPSSMLGRLVVTDPDNIAWITPDEIQMFPLGVVVGSVDSTEFPLELSGYDELLNDQAMKGEPLSLPKYISPGRPVAYQVAGVQLPHPPPITPYIEKAPVHTPALQAMAEAYVSGFDFSMNTTSDCRSRQKDWSRGCQEGLLAKAKSYFVPSQRRYVPDEVRDWLASYDQAYSTHSDPGDCGSGFEPDNDGCRIGSSSWKRLEQVDP